MVGRGWTAWKMGRPFLRAGEARNEVPGREETEASSLIRP